MSDEKKFHKVLRPLISGIPAGIMIGIGGFVFLASDVKAVGALFFCVGLTAICSFGLHLYTGRVGTVLDTKAFAELGLTWLGNLVGTALCGWGVAAAKPDMAAAAESACLPRLSQTLGTSLILGFFCGILMYVAVTLYKKNAQEGFAKYLGILLCVPTFILCGCEHSVADMFYMALGGHLVDGFWFLIKVSIGNAAGAILFHTAVKYIGAKQ